MWVPPPPTRNSLKESDLEAYLARVYLLWPKKTGMNEEIALRLLMLNNYEVKRALSFLESSHMGASYEIVHLINQMTQADAKIEFIGYLNKLTEPSSKQ